VATAGKQWASKVFVEVGKKAGVVVNLKTGSMLRPTIFGGLSGNGGPPA